MNSSPTLHLSNNSTSNNDGVAKPRSSNLELYRIICMIMIVAHHFVVNSGVKADDGPILSDPFSANSVYLLLFGMWGKVGINCFLMITGYFMCKSQITVRKFLKLILQVYLYNWLVFACFLITGYETFSLKSMYTLIMPVTGFSDGFVSCFLAFWLTIPFLSILVQNMNKRQHQLLLLLLIGCYTILGSIPVFYVRFNYITWFCIIFLIASYIRLYPNSLFENKKLWGWMTLALVVVAMVSVPLMQHLINYGYFFVADSNKILAVAVAVSSFLWFKNLNIPQSKFINAIGGSTFGVLLIHANSDAMRTWLWKDTVDVIGHYNLPFLQLIVFSVVVVLSVFFICNLIDQLRVQLLEKPFFKWYDKTLSIKVDKLLDRLIS